MTVLVVDPSAVVALLKSELGWEALALRLHAAASCVLSAAGRPPVGAAATGSKSITLPPVNFPAIRTAARAG